MYSIYLAGKISKNDWRHDVVKSLHGEWGSDGELPGSWPVLENAVCSILDYTGPYFASDDHGCWHRNNTHGAAGLGPACNESEVTGGCADSYPAFSQKQVQDECLRAIQRSHIVFAWVDDVSAHGTFTELGYARALGKYIIIARPKIIKQLWFVYGMANTIGDFNDPVTAIEEMATAWLQRRQEANEIGIWYGDASPIEQDFWDAYVSIQNEVPELDGLKPEWETAQYHIDFALPDLMIGIELDGHASHSSTTAIAKDRQRQRYLEEAGWHIIRFGGQEVYRDAHECVRQAAQIIKRRISASKASGY